MERSSESTFLNNLILQAASSYTNSFLCAEQCTTTSSGVLSRARSLATNPLFLPSMLLAPSVSVPTNFLSQVGPPKNSLNMVDVAPSIPWASPLATFLTPTKCTLIVPLWQHRMNASSASVRLLSVEPSVVNTGATGTFRETVKHETVPSTILLQFV